MKLQDFERIFDRIAIRKLTMILTVGSLACFLFGAYSPSFLSKISFVPEAVTRGEIWRIATFPFFPFSSSLIFFIFAYMAFFFMGTALESEWGDAKYTGYLLIGFVATMAAAFLTPSVPTTNVFITLSVFLAFAYLYPGFVFHVFFIIPVEAKYLAWISWLFLGLAVIFGDWTQRIAALASVVNFFLFFGGDIFYRIRVRQGEMRERSQNIRQQTKVFHRCSVCGVTDQSHPEYEFRCCSRCKNHPEYCEKHIVSHTHVV